VYTELRERGYGFAGNLVDRANAPSIAARRKLGAHFQRARILKLPGLRPRIIGRRFVMGQTASASR